MRHPNLCCAYKVYPSKKANELHILMDYCDGGEISTLIRNDRGKSLNDRFLTEEKILSIFT